MLVIERTESNKVPFRVPNSRERLGSTVSPEEKPTAAVFSSSYFATPSFAFGENISPTAIVCNRLP